MKPWKPPHVPITGYYFALSQIWSQLRIDKPTSLSTGVWHYRNRLMANYGVAPQTAEPPNGRSNADES